MVLHGGESGPARNGPSLKPLPSCDIKGVYHHPGQVMLILNTWLRWCWSPFSTAPGQVALFGRSLRSVYGRRGRYGVSNRLFGILPHGRFVSSVYLFSHLFLSLWAHRYLFSTLGYIPILLYFIAQIVPTLAIESSISLLLCSFDVYTQSLFFFFF